MKVTMIVILVSFLLCLHGRSEEVILTLRAVDCFNTKLDSNEVYWYTYQPNINLEGCWDQIWDFAVDKNGCIHIPQIILVPKYFEGNPLFNKHWTGIRIQVFSSDGLLKRIIQIEFPDSALADIMPYTPTNFGRVVNDILVSDDGSYFLKSGDVIIKIANDCRLERVWGSLGYGNIKESLRERWELERQGYHLGNLYFDENGSVVSGNLTFDREGKLLKKDDAYLSRIKSTQYFIQSIDGEIHTVDYTDPSSMALINRNGRRFSYDLSYGSYGLPFNILENGDLLVYRIKKSGIVRNLEPIEDKSGLLLVWRDEKGKIDPYIYVVKERYSPE